jgi:hypothetical protein
MKLQINTDVKTITVEDSVNLGELFELLMVMFPNFTWKEFLLCPVNKIEYWSNPVIIPWQPTPWIYPVDPFIHPLALKYVTGECITESNTSVEGAAVTSSVYNLVINKK